MVGVMNNNLRILAKYKYSTLQNYHKELCFSEPANLPLFITETVQLVALLISDFWLLLRRVTQE